MRMGRSERWTDADVFKALGRSHWETVEEYDRWCQNWPRGLVQHVTSFQLIQEVTSGGFEQYFMSLAGVGAEEAKAGLRDMNMNGLAAIVEEALARFPGGYARDRETRIQQLQLMDGESETMPETMAVRRFEDLSRRFLLHPEYEEVRD